MGGVFGDVVEVFVGEGDFGEFFFCFGEGAVYNACVEVFVEEAGVEDEDGKVGGDAELADFEDVVACMGVAVEVLLSPVEFEADGVAFFICNPVEVVEPPLLV